MPRATSANFPRKTNFALRMSCASSSTIAPMATPPKFPNSSRTSVGASASRSIFAEDEVGRLMAEYQPHADKLAKFDADLAAANIPGASATAKFEKQREKLAAKITERDEKIAESRRRAADDRRNVDAVGAE